MRLPRKGSRANFACIFPRKLVYCTSPIRTGIEVVITALTRNQVVSQEARGFESHPVRQCENLRPHGRGFSHKRGWDSKGAGVNDVPGARQSRAPARPQAGNPTLSATSSQAAYRLRRLFMLCIKSHLALISLLLLSKSKPHGHSGPRQRLRPSVVLGFDFVLAAPRLPPPHTCTASPCAIGVTRAGYLCTSGAVSTNDDSGGNVSS